MFFLFSTYTYRLLFIIINTGCLLMAVECHCQALNDERIQLKLDNLNNIHPRQTLFVQTDKTTYANNETIWFAGTILENSWKKNIQADILCVSLVDAASGQPVMQKNYLVSNNLCSGSLLLPDTIRPGRYVLIAATNIANKNGAAPGIYKQRIIIKSTARAMFTSSFSVETNTNSAFYTIHIDTRFTNGRYLPSGIVRYNLDGQQSNKLTLGNDGKGTIIVTMQDADKYGHKLYTSTQYDTVRQNLVVQLPLITDPVKVNFYPEGGYLVSGLANRVMMEAITASGKPTPFTGLLFKNDKCIDTIVTGSDGHAAFTFLPVKDGYYTLRKASGGSQDTTVFQLPAVLNNGIVIQVNEAVANDTLRAQLYSRYTKTVRLFLSNNNYGYLSNPVVIPLARAVKLPLSPLTRGICTLTVLDSADRPLAERVFFAHFDKVAAVDIYTGKESFKTREKILLTLQVKDQEHKLTGGIVTVACVQSGRIKGQDDMASYYYLKQWLDLPVETARKALGTKALLENLLLLRGWRRYTWQEIINTGEADSIPAINKIPLDWQVYHNNNVLKKPVTVAIKFDSAVSTLKTNADGSFRLNAADIALTENRAAYMMVAGNNNLGYRITATDTTARFIYNQITGVRFNVNDQTSAVQDSKQWFIDDSLKANVLQEVIVHAKEKPYNAADQPMGYTNECGDYLCYGGALNCPYHPPASAPVKGHNYFVYGQGIVTYNGCYQAGQERMFKLAKVFTAREFYGMDSNLLQQQTPEYMSTIFWRPFARIPKNGELKLSFFAGDIKGDFSILVQGISDDGDIIFKEARINIVE